MRANSAPKRTPYSKAQMPYTIGKYRTSVENACSAVEFDGGESSRQLLRNVLQLRGVARFESSKVNEPNHEAIYYASGEAGLQALRDVRQRKSDGPNGLITIFPRSDFCSPRRVS